MNMLSMCSNSEFISAQIDLWHSKHTKNSQIFHENLQWLTSEEHKIRSIISRRSRISGALSNEKNTSESQINIFYALKIYSSAFVSLASSNLTHTGHIHLSVVLTQPSIHRLWKERQQPLHIMRIFTLVWQIQQYLSWLSLKIRWKKLWNSL